MNYHNYSMQIGCDTVATTKPKARELNMMATCDSCSRMIPLAVHKDRNTPRNMPKKTLVRFH